jgi:predicted permease
VPTFLRRLRARIKYWNNAEELKRELDAHRELAAASFATAGDSERESRWKAARLLGNTTLAREDSRAVWISRWAEQLLQDTRYSLRTMRREWGFAITASVTLALGLGVLVGVFTVFNAIFLRPWPVRSPAAVFGISESLVDPRPTDGFTGPGNRISYVVWNEIRSSLKSADLVVKYDYQDTLRPSTTGPGRSGRFALVSDGFLDTIGLPMQVGSLRADTSVPAILITDGVWRSVFGGDPAIVGRTVHLGDHAIVITGVFAPEFRGFPPRDYDGIMRLDPQTVTWLNRGLTVAPDLLTNPKRCCVEVVGRLRPNFSRADAAREIESRVNTLHADMGLPKMSVTTWDTTIAGRPSGIKSTMPALFALLFAGCATVTLLACANIGNLQLARGLKRSREVAMRLSLGADRSRLVRQFLTESAVLASIGGAGGLLIAWTVPPMVMSLDIGSLTTYTPDARVVVFSIVVAAAATLLSGLAPALRITKVSWRSAGAAGSPRTGRLRGFLLATQIALSLSLIASAALLSRAAQYAANGANTGIAIGDTNAYLFAVRSGSDTTAADRARRDELKAVLTADPNVALADVMPFEGHQATPRLTTAAHPEGLPTQWSGLNHAAAALLKLPLESGRWPSEDWRLHEAVVSRSVARALWNSEDIIGHVFTAAHPFNGTADYTVVGVMGEIRLQDSKAMPAVIVARRDDYLPYILGTPADEAHFKTIATRIDPTLRVGTRPLMYGLRLQLQGTFVGASIASGLGLVALLLASLGVFGVFAYIVEERRREIGVRLALGANRAQVRRSVVVAVRGPVIGGVAAGLGFAIAGGFILRGSLYGLSVLDPLSYLAVAALLTIAAIGATYIPLRRATRVDPAVTLRAD